MLTVVILISFTVRGGSRTAATSKMELFLIISINYHKELYFGCCSSSRYASDLHILILMAMSLEKKKATKL